VRCEWRGEAREGDGGISVGVGEDEVARVGDGGRNSGDLVGPWVDARERKRWGTQRRREGGGGRVRPVAATKRGARGIWWVEVGERKRWGAQRRQEGGGGWVRVSARGEYIPEAG
jgi:hypothetical protein